jgi:hypothetical protein
MYMIQEDHALTDCSKGVLMLEIRGVVVDSLHEEARDSKPHAPEQIEP